MDGSRPSGQDAHREQGSRQYPVVNRPSRYAVPAAPQRRSRLLQMRQDDADTPAQQKNCKEFPQSRLALALYPMEHAWMLSAAEGNCDALLEFVSEEPLLLTRRDFISGYSVLHWLAKRGQDETLLKLLHRAERAGGRPVCVDVRGSGGLTPLHVASMHGHYAVVKLLVGAFGADVDVMDYGGRRPWQYLRPDAPREMKELLGTWDDEHASRGDRNANKNCNNSSGDVTVTPGEEAEGVADEVDWFKRRGGSRRFGSLTRFFSFRTIKH
ncbi:ankyrin repeat domain-containing protein SOWAHD [Syngnathoides biaculeatus]|uniref:ankyrin repeat domain-containing protein SOWAHD n=1 Tax=Syngnathoides biaculeatus TaxID=300417 RepID=UPI002ADD71EF|nr:ankyrin repeat domain-containing protein SOWAHD [Syngnathoides biaculeatus]